MVLTAIFATSGICNFTNMRLFIKLIKRRGVVGKVPEIDVAFHL